MIGPKARNITTLLKKGDGKYAVGGSLSLTIRGKSKRWEYQFRDPVTGKLTSRYWPATGPAAIGLSDARAERNRVWLANREERRRARSSTHTHSDLRRRQDRTFYDAVWSHLPTEKKLHKAAAVVSSPSMQGNGQTPPARSTTARCAGMPRRSTRCAAARSVRTTSSPY